ncbi:MAG: hypothetical protein K2J02_01775, partial [Malacoplasma sp.]|nr:hypothetical protein [Malacoplasma sp.]
MGFFSKLKNLFKRNSKKIKNAEQQRPIILNQNNFQLPTYLEENQESTFLNKEEIADKAEITKLEIQKMITRSAKIARFTDVLARGFFDFIDDKKEFDFEKNLRILDFFLNTKLIEQNSDMDRKFKELLMIYFFEKAIVEKNIENITVPLFDNIDIDWTQDWNQRNENMSVCFDFNNKYGNNFKLCSMQECTDYVINKIRGNFSENRENLNYLIARAKMTENFFDILKESNNDSQNSLIGLFGEYYIANKLLYGKPTKNIKNLANFYSEDYIPENLEYLEKICLGFNKDKYLYKKIKEEKSKNNFYLKPDVLKLLWMRNKDQLFSDSDFIISYPVYHNESNRLKGYCIKFLEVKSTKNFYQYLPKKFFEHWVKDEKRNKYWYDSIKL